MELYKFSPGTTPLLVSMPHCGIHVPDEIAGRFTPAARLLTDTDWHVDRLYDFAADLGAGVLGMSAMVLPGISGAYMLLIMGRYQAICAAIDVVKKAAMNGGDHPQLTSAFEVLVPTAIGAILSLVLLSNVLKWLLYHHRDATLGVLLGILLGAVVGIWPFDGASLMVDYVIGSSLAVAGLAATMLLSRIGR